MILLLIHDLVSKIKKIEPITIYDEALKINPKDIKMLNNKGVVFVLLDEYKKAIRCFDQALKIDPEDAVLWHNKGVALTGLGKHQEALIYYDKALELNPRLDPAKNQENRS